jgi:hypothetical protein
MKAVLLRSKAIKLRLQFEPDNFQFVCLSSGSFQMDRAAFAYIILCPCVCSGKGGSKRRSRPNSVFVTQSFSMQS